MRRYTASVLSVLGLFAAFANGQNKPNLSGKWQINATKSEIHSGQPCAAALIIEQKGPAIHVVKTTKSGDKETVMEFNCTTDGKECASGSTKVSLWYDGASLVEMDVAGESAIKSKMTMDPAGKTISVEVVHIFPQAAADTLLLDKV